MNRNRHMNYDRADEEVLRKSNVCRSAARGVRYDGGIETLSLIHI